MAFVAPRLIDLAIFGTLGCLWIFGLVFIVVLYRWIRRFEQEGPGGATLTPEDAVKQTAGPSEAAETHTASRAA